MSFRVTIVVNDESRGKRSFEGERQDVIRAFPFFANQNDAIINVACDSQIFELLWEGDNSKIIASPSCVIPCLIAATFLQMELVDSLIKILSADMALLVQLSRQSDLTLLPAPLISKLASAISLLNLEHLLSLRESEGGARRLAHKVFKTKLEALLRQTPISCCSACKDLFRVQDESLLSCSGRHSSHHVIDPTFSLQKHIIDLRVEQKRSWRDLYFMIWGSAHVLYCHRCHNHYQARNLSSACIGSNDHLMSPPLHSYGNSTPWSDLIATLQDHRQIIAPTASTSSDTMKPHHLLNLYSHATSEGGIATFSSGGASISDLTVKANPPPLSVLSDLVNDNLKEKVGEEEGEEEKDEEEQATGDSDRKMESEVDPSRHPSLFSLDTAPSLGLLSDQETSGHKPRRLRVELLREDDLYRMDLLIKQLLASRARRPGQPTDPPPPSVPLEPTASRPEPSRQHDDRAGKERQSGSSASRKHQPPPSSLQPKSPDLPSNERSSRKTLRPPPPHLPIRESTKSSQPSSKIGSAIRRPSSTLTPSYLHPSQVSASALKAYSWFD